MNITEKQKRIILNYMKENPDFARGRLRYNSSNKKILVSIIYFLSKYIKSKDLSGNAIIIYL